MSQTILNIKNSDKIFKYVIRCNTSNINRNIKNISYYKDNDNIYFLKNNEITNRVIRKGNDWILEYGFAEGDTQYIPWDEEENTPIYNESTIDLLFPVFSVDTYERGVKYALTVNTWIYGKCIWLGSWIVDRLDSLAITNGIERIQSSEYVDYQTFEIINPWDLIYSDSWSEWRQEICGEPNAMNNTGSILSITLYPIKNCDIENQWMMLDGYTGSGGGINISKSIDDYFSLQLNFDNVEKKFNESIIFNQEYIHDLHTYMLETYNIDVKNIRWELIAKDENDIYGAWTFTDSDGILETNMSFDNVNFDNWSGWKEGIYMQGGISLIDVNDIEIISFLSNKIPLTKEIFKYIINDNKFPKSIDLESIDMKNYTINAVNKIQKNIVQIPNPSNNKAGLIMPIFFQTREAENLIIHPSVTEVIAINLDSYKSQVKTFIIQIEDTTFTEIGRTGRGILFKIVGASLPNLNPEGYYYILNENGDVVTNGKYVYNS